MTEIECLEKIVALWEYHSAYPKATKKNTYAALGFEQDANDCPCCEYCDQYGYGCVKCPLLYLWPLEGADDSITPCMRSGSVYSRWSAAKNYDEKTLYAKQIAVVSGIFLDNARRNASVNLNMEYENE